MNGRLTPLQRNANPLRTERMQFLLSGCLYCGDFASCADVCFSREICIYLCSTWLRDFLSCVVEVEGHWRYIIFLSSCLVHLILRCRSNSSLHFADLSHNDKGLPSQWPYDERRVFCASVTGFGTDEIHHILTATNVMYALLSTLQWCHSWCCSECNSSAKDDQTWRRSSKLSK